MPSCHRQLWPEGFLMYNIIFQHFKGRTVNLEGHSDSRMNRFNFGGQRRSSLWLHAHSMETWNLKKGFPQKRWTWTQAWPDFWGQNCFFVRENLICFFKNSYLFSPNSVFVFLVFDVLLSDSPFLQNSKKWCQSALNFLHRCNKRFLSNVAQTYTSGWTGEWCHMSWFLPMTKPQKPVQPIHHGAI